MTDAFVCDECETVVTPEVPTATPKSIEIHRHIPNGHSSVDLCENCAYKYGLVDLLKENEYTYGDE